MRVYFHRDCYLAAQCERHLGSRAFKSSDKLKRGRMKPKETFLSNARENKCRFGLNCSMPADHRKTYKGQLSLDEGA